MEILKELQDLKGRIMEKDEALSSLKSKAEKLRKTEQAQNQIVNELKPNEEQRRKMEPKELLKLQAEIREHLDIMQDSGRLAALQEAEAELMMVELDDLKAEWGSLASRGRSNHLAAKEKSAIEFFKNDLASEHLETLLALANHALDSFKSESRPLYLEMVRANMTEREIWARVSGKALIEKLAELVGTANPCDKPGYWGGDLSRLTTKNKSIASNRPSGPLTRKQKVIALKARVEELQSQEFSNANH